MVSRRSVEEDSRAAVVATQYGTRDRTGDDRPLSGRSIGCDAARRAHARSSPRRANGCEPFRADAPRTHVVTTGHHRRFGSNPAERLAWTKIATFLPLLPQLRTCSSIAGRLALSANYCREHVQQCARTVPTR